MKNILKIGLVVFVMFGGVISQINPVYAEENKRVVFDAKVLESSAITEQEGLRMQIVTCEILNGDYKGTVREVQVFIEKEFSRPIQIGDRIKVSLIDINGELYIQFYDFSRSYGYVWLFGLFLLAFFMFVGWRGIQTLFPSIVVILLIVLGILPDFLPKGTILITSLVVIFIVAISTAWLRLKDRVHSAISSFSVLVSLLIGFLIFVGFSQTAYVLPFLGTVISVDDQILFDVMEVLLASVLFIPLGGVINSSIRISRYLLKKYRTTQNIALGPMLKKSLTLSQKTAANEFNNLVLTIAGISFTGIFIVKAQYPEMRFWDNGWIALQVIYCISAGIAILTIAPITAFVTALFLVIPQQRSKSGKQRLLTRSSK